MLDLLILFWTFFKIGLFTIGGGYAMIPMINSEVIAKGWLSEIELQNFLAVSESTPGPFAINIATFVGLEFGFIGAIVATIGVVLPSFIIILIISKIVDKFLKNRFVGYALSGVRPVVIGLIASVSFMMIYKGLYSEKIIENFIFDYKALIIMVIAFVMLRFKKLSHPILVILTSAILGIIFYYFIP